MGEERFTVITIDGWRCTENYPGEPWASREAVRGNVTVTADADGLDLDESWRGYEGGSGRYQVPANVLMWLTQAVR